WRKPERLEQVLLCCEADHCGRLGLEAEPYPQRDIFQRAYQAALSVEVQAVIAAGFQGKHIKQELDKRRVAAISTG
ncbi:MAG: multifunctional CCA addition/repair protein, partial [Vibrio sp.]